MFWQKPSPELPYFTILSRIAAALERHNFLYELALNQSGVTTQTGREEGEVLTTDLEAIQKKEFEDELRRLYGLKPEQQLEPTAPDGGSWRNYLLAQAKERPTPEAPADPGDSIFNPGGSWGLGLGPEGAESAEPGIEAAWIDQFNPPSAFARPGGRAEPEGQSRPDSGPEPQRSAEEYSVTASETPGT